MVHRRKGRRLWEVKVPTRTGWVTRSTETADKITANAMARMLKTLGRRGGRDWDLLDRVEAGTLTVAELYDAYRANDLTGLRARLDDVDLSAYRVDWERWLEGRVVEDTQAHYTVHMESLMPPQKPFLRSSLSPKRIDAWLGKLEVSGSTKRKYLAAAASFFGYLVGLGVITSQENPVRDIKAPRANKPRTHFLEMEEVKALLARVENPYRSLFALIYGTGIEVSTALALTRGAVKDDTREILAPGTKTYNRRRVVRVAEWAWPFVEALVDGKLPRAHLFPGINRWTASDVHRDACEAAGLTGYQLRDSRHHWAVRAARAGTPPEIIARQLGHANATMVLKVYGVFFPDTQDREKWEQIATAQDGKVGEK